MLPIEKGKTLWWQSSKEGCWMKCYRMMRPVAAHWQHKGGTVLRNVTVIPTTAPHPHLSSSLGLGDIADRSLKQPKKNSRQVDSYIKFNFKERCTQECHCHHPYCGRPPTFVIIILRIWELFTALAEAEECQSLCLKWTPELPKPHVLTIQNMWFKGRGRSLWFILITSELLNP